MDRVFSITKITNVTFLTISLTVAQSTVQGVQQLHIDQQLRLFSCGADASLKFRTLPSVYNMTHLV